MPLVLSSVKSERFTSRKEEISFANQNQVGLEAAMGGRSYKSLCIKSIRTGFKVPPICFTSKSEFRDAQTSSTKQPAK